MVNTDSRAGCALVRADDMGGRLRLTSFSEREVDDVMRPPPYYHPDCIILCISKHLQTSRHRRVDPTVDMQFAPPQLATSISLESSVLQSLPCEMLHLPAPQDSCAFSTCKVV